MNGASAELEKFVGTSDRRCRAMSMCKKKKKKKKHHVVCEAQLPNGRAYKNRGGWGGVRKRASRNIVARSFFRFLRPGTSYVRSVRNTQCVSCPSSYFVSNLFLANTEADTLKIDRRCDQFRVYSVHAKCPSLHFDSSHPDVFT